MDDFTPVYRETSAIFFQKNDFGAAKRTAGTLVHLKNPTGAGDGLTGAGGNISAAFRSTSIRNTNSQATNACPVSLVALIDS